jgi:aconitate hydratase
MKLQPGDRIEVAALPESLRPRGAVPVAILRKDGTRTPVAVTAAVETQFEIDLLRDGGVIPHILLNATRKAA